MALWKEPVAKDPMAKEPNPIARDFPMGDPDAVGARFVERTNLEKLNVEKSTTVPVAADTTRKSPARVDAKESIIASDLTIEGKIEGTGHVRIAGRFKGDVKVEGNLTIESGARLTGEVRANAVIVGGELEGNIEAAARVELLQTGVLNGDLKAGSLTVAAGSRMRGRAEFGWDEKSPSKPEVKS